MVIAILLVSAAGCQMFEIPRTVIRDAETGELLAVRSEPDGTLAVSLPSQVIAVGTSAGEVAVALASGNYTAIAVAVGGLLTTIVGLWGGKEYCKRKETEALHTPAPAVPAAGT